MTKQQIVRDIERLYGGRSFITQTEFARLFGINTKNVHDKLDGLERVYGKYYFVPDIAERLMDRRER